MIPSTENLKLFSEDYLRKNGSKGEEVTERGRAPLYLSPPPQCGTCWNMSRSRSLDCIISGQLHCRGGGVDLL